MDLNNQDKGEEKGKDWNSRAQQIRKKQKLKTQEEQ